jgi:hypothetical protein
MFVEFLAQMVAALIERELRQRMVEKQITHLFSLPERRASTTPTIEQVLRLFEHQDKHHLYDGDRLDKVQPSTANGSGSTGSAIHKHRYFGVAQDPQCLTAQDD